MTLLFLLAEAALAVALSVLVFWLNCIFAVRDWWIQEKISTGSKGDIIVVTGCDSGFGLMTSLKLTAMGYTVISVCLTDEGCDRLKDTVGMTLKCDITNEIDVANLAAKSEQFVAEKVERLFGVINNAGIIDIGAVDWMPLTSFKRVMEVNYFGAVAVTKAMLPLLKHNAGSRIIFVSSVAGFHSVGLASAYFASKHALEGFTKSLRQELRAWNVHVCNVNPSFTRTPLTAGLSDMALRSFNSGPNDVTSQYSKSFLENITAYLDYILEEPSVVVDKICDVLTDKRPVMWNYPGMQSKIIRCLCNANSGLIDFVMELGKSVLPQPHSKTVESIQLSK